MGSKFILSFSAVTAFALGVTLAEPASACGPYTPPTPEQQASGAALRQLAKLPLAKRPSLDAIWTDGDVAVARVVHPNSNRVELLVLRSVNGDFRVVRTVRAR